MAANTNAAGSKAGMDRNVDRVAEGAHEYVDRATQAASQMAERLGEHYERLSERSEELMAMKDDWVEAAREYVKEKPFQAIGMAVAAGYLLSMLMRSK